MATATASLGPAAELHRKLMAERKPPFREQNVHEALRQSQQTFVDIFFPPNKISVGAETTREGLVGLVGKVSIDLGVFTAPPDPEKLVWRRPIQFIDLADGLRSPPSASRGSWRAAPRSAAHRSRCSSIALFTRGARRRRLIVASCRMRCAS